MRQSANTTGSELVVVRVQQTAMPGGLVVQRKTTPDAVRDPSGNTFGIGFAK